MCPLHILASDPIPLIEYQRCAWLPVDTLATSILEIFESLAFVPKTPDFEPEEASVFYNLVNPSAFTWDCVLSELREAGLKFKSVPVSEWLHNLQDSAAKGDSSDANPSIKLIDYYKSQYQSDQGPEGASIVFESSEAQMASAAMRRIPKMIGTGYMPKVLAAWMQKW